MTNSKKKVMIIVSMLCLLCGLFFAGINTVRAENNNLANLFSDNENSGSALQAEESYKVRLTFEEGIDRITTMGAKPSDNNDYFESVEILLNSNNLILSVIVVDGYSQESLEVISTSSSTMINIVGPTCLISNIVEDQTITFSATPEGDSYDIRYYIDGELTELKPNKYYTSVETKLWEPREERKGYTFYGWYKNADYSGEIFNSIPKGSVGAMDLFSRWTPNRYKITMEPKGGSVSKSSEIVVYDEYFTLPIATRTGYRFLGWHTEWDSMVTKSNGESREPWHYDQDMTLYAHWLPLEYTITMVPNGGSVSKDSETVTYDDRFKLPVPTRNGYDFTGWYADDINEAKITDNQGNSLSVWNYTDNITVYAHWEAKEYTVTINFGGGNGSGETEFKIKSDAAWPQIDNLPTRYGYDFTGYYILGEIYYFASGRPRYSTFTLYRDVELVAYWEEQHYYIYIEQKHAMDSSGVGLASRTFNVFSSEVFVAPDSMSYKDPQTGTTDIRLFTEWRIAKDNGVENSWLKFSTEKEITVSVSEIKKFYSDLEPFTQITIRALYNTIQTCIAEGTMITLADGTQKPVEKLTGDEQLLVWNFEKGIFDTAPILFVDSDKQALYEVVYLHFADGGVVKVLTEHAFWDFDLNKFIYLRNDAAKYIGHYFNKQTTDKDGNLKYCKVQLVNVEIREEQTTAWSPLTYGYMGYYVNGMLSMPGAGESFINIFEVDPETMTYDKDAMEEDIMTYGLYSYEEFAELVPVSREVFEAFNGKYLKISIAKGNTTIERILELVEIYKEFLQ